LYESGVVLCHQGEHLWSPLILSKKPLSGWPMCQSEMTCDNLGSHLSGLFINLQHIHHSYTQQRQVWFIPLADEHRVCR